MRIVEDIKLDYEHVLLMPKRSDVDSRSKVSLEREFKFKYSNAQFNGIPIIAANMDHTGTMQMARAFNSYKMSVALHKFYQEQILINYFNSDTKNPYTFYTMGITQDDFDKFVSVYEQVGSEKKPQFICIDVANGYSRKLVQFVQKMRDTFPYVCIMAGNVVTGDMVYDLLEKGADIVKIGIGPGSVCTTRRVTGVGYPQLSAVMECADAAHGREKGLICADGGVVHPGDFAKAFGGGADFVMCGGIFAGHDECEGEIVRDYHLIKDGPNAEEEKRYTNGKIVSMKFHGMSSKEAMDQHYGGKANYRASEGKEVYVPYKGDVSDTIEEILGGLRSACTYTGAYKLKDLPKVATFIRVEKILNTSLGD